MVSPWFNKSKPVLKKYRTENKSYGESYGTYLTLFKIMSWFFPLSNFIVSLFFPIFIAFVAWTFPMEISSLIFIYISSLPNRQSYYNSI